MKKNMLLKLAVLFIALASFHLFSMPHSVQVYHHAKVVADQESHEMKIVQTAGDEKKQKHVNAVFAAFTALLVIGSMAAGFARITYTDRFDRKKKHLLAVFYQSSNFRVARVNPII
ncbi:MULTISPECIES: hypothetical protein [Bacillus]|uniref:hypothetical protein n=1 Tax=Bacillus TaxID=1386 RepID=UPI00064E8108|nr:MULTISPECIES: hypothetical protein [Bacillus]KML18446.1 hypothetical protein VL09_05350 [Bacillus stratosphericus]MBX7002187.1 hypothetical protein [Bacillus aerophilus]KML61955.1 hypothetical protein VL19_08125 [Bacillus stratosphericus]KMN31260.1 hypothetical protein ABW26_13765 [Bacillus stratosphericus]KMN70223.1 hypothetical protein VK97_17095 [Bacillus sp. LK10]